MSEQQTTTEAHQIPSEELERDAVTGGDILVSLMREAGTDVAFGVISIHNMPLVEAVDRDLRFVPVRHEAAAINAADGYARATGKIGVAITSTGTGAGNAAGSMLEALTAGSRVLHVTGNVNLEQIGEGKGAYHEVPRQLQMLEAVSAHALRITDEKKSRATLREAVRLLASAPSGPVSVDWPIDLQYLAKPDEQEDAPDIAPGLLHAPDEAIQAAAERLRASRRPLLWAGGGARAAASDVVALAEALGAGVLSGNAGRGVVPDDHPLLVGNFPTTDAVEPLLGEADLLVTVGSHLRGQETKAFQLALPQRHVQIDVDADIIGKNFPVEVAVNADARAAVPALLAALGQTEPDPAWAARVREVAEAARADHREEIGAYAELCNLLTRRLPRRTVVVRDVTVPGSSWGSRLLPLYDSHDNVFAAGGGIGQGLAQAIGAGVGRPDDPVVAIVGDGGLQLYLGELAVLADQAPHVVVLIFNDGGYGILGNIQDAREAERRAVDLVTPDFGLVAQAVGLPHVRTGSAEAFDAALADALERRGPSVIEIDVTALSPAPDPIVPPIEVPQAG